MLQQSMGSPMAFEYRRQELKELNMPDNDEMVAKSYVDSVDPEGFMTKFIANGKIVFKIG